MYKSEGGFKLTGLEIAIGINVMLCLALCGLLELAGVSIQALAVCTGAVMCVQEGGKASLGACKNRLLGVVSGGVLGVIIVLIDNALDIKLIFWLLSALGIMANFVVCRAMKLPQIQARVSCITLLLVILVLGGDARIGYALGRFIGTLAGAVVSCVVSLVYAKLAAKKEEKK